MISANSAVVDDNIPGPQSDRIPLAQISAFMRRLETGALTFLTSKRFLPSAPPSPAFALLATFLDAVAEPEVTGASVISTSAMLCAYDRTFGVRVADEEETWGT